MKSKLKRALSLLVVLAMSLSLMSLSVFAVDDFSFDFGLSGDDSEDVAVFTVGGFTVMVVGLSDPEGTYAAAIAEAADGKDVESADDVRAIVQSVIDPGNEEEYDVLIFPSFSGWDDDWDWDDDEPVSINSLYDESYEEIGDSVNLRYLGSMKVFTGILWDSNAEIIGYNWTSSAPDVIAVTADEDNSSIAVIESLAAGSATITVTVSYELEGEAGSTSRSFTATATEPVRGYKSVETEDELREAITADPDDCEYDSVEITLLNDVTVTSPIEIGRDVTLNLGGNQIISGLSSAARIFTITTGQVVFEVNGGGGGIVIPETDSQTQGILTIGKSDDAAVNSAVRGSTVRFSGGRYINENDCATALIRPFAAVTLELNGVTMESADQVIRSNPYHLGSVLNITDSTLSKTKIVNENPGAVVTACSTTTTIRDSRLISTKDFACEFPGGSVNIYNSSFEAGEGSSWKNSGIAVSSDCVANIYDGTFSAAGTAVEVYSSGGTINIYDGTFEGSENAIWALFDNDRYGGTYHGAEVNVYGGQFEGNLTTTTYGTGKTAAITITGGTFSTDPSAYVDTTEYNVIPSYYDEDGTPAAPYRVEEKQVAYVDSTNRWYPTLAKAFAAVPANGVETGIFLSEDAEYDVDLTSNKNIVLELGGNTLTSDSISVAAGSLTIRNGTVDVSDWSYLVGSGDSALRPGEASKLVIDYDAVFNGNILTQPSGGSAAYGYQLDVRGTVNGLIFVSGNAHSGNGEVNIYGEVISPEDIGIAGNGYSTINVYNGAYVYAKDPGTEYGTGIEVRQGNLNVYGGTIVGTGHPADATANNSGTTSHGAGVAISPYDLSDVAVSISDGTLQGFAPLFIKNTKATATKRVSVSVTGGTFEITEADGLDAVAVNNVNETRVTKFITGGTFDTDPSDYVAKGYGAAHWSEEDPYIVAKQLSAKFVNGSSSKTILYVPGENPEEKYESLYGTPTQTATAEYTYEFADWEFSDIDSSGTVIFTARFYEIPVAGSNVEVSEAVNAETGEKTVTVTDKTTGDKTETSTKTTVSEGTAALGLAESETETATVATTTTNNDGEPTATATTEQTVKTAAATENDLGDKTYTYTVKTYVAEGTETNATEAKAAAATALATAVEADNANTTTTVTLKAEKSEAVVGFEWWEIDERNADVESALTEGANDAAKSVITTAQVDESLLSGKLTALAESAKVDGENVAVEVALTLDTKLTDYAVEDGEATTVTYEVKPVLTATVKIDDVVQSVSEPEVIPNEKLVENAEITVKLPIPASFVPAVGYVSGTTTIEIKHVDDSGVLKGYITGTIYGDAGSGYYVEFTVSEFSSFEIVPAEKVFITFDLADGGDPVERTYDKGAEITDAPTPTRAGYTFTGWDEAVTSATTSKTYTAQWRRNIVFYDDSNSAMRGATVNIGDEDTPLSELPNFYADVADDSWARDAIAYVTALGIMNGVGGDQFAPAATTTGAMLTAMLYRAVTGETTSGEDWAEAATEWAEKLMLTDGIGYVDNAALTREQMVVMMYRIAESTGFDVSSADDLAAYVDADSLSGYALDAMKWAVSVGLVKGTDADRLSPAANVTREQIAMIMMRFDGLTKGLA